MMKFFRKYTKHLLAVFMALLLITWLGGSALTELVRPSGAKIVEATSRFGDFRAKDRFEANATLDLLNALGLPWQAPLGFATPGVDPLTVHDWMLLVREAREMGIRVRTEEAQDFLFAQGRSTQAVNAVAFRLKRAPEDLYVSTAQFLAVRKALATVAQARQTSEAEVRVAVRNMREQVRIDLVALKAEAFVDQDAAITEAELKDFFQKYREQKRGDGLTFGYFQEPRVRAQYVRIDLDKVKQDLRIGESTLERRAREFWKENRQAPVFRRPPEPPTPPAEPAEVQPESDGAAAADEPPAADQASDGASDAPEPSEPSDVGSGEAETLPEQEAEDADTTPEPEGSPAPSPGQEPAAPAETTPPTPPPAPSPYYETYREAREAAIEAVRETFAADRAVRVADYLIQRLGEPWYESPMEEDGYHEMPEGADALDLLDRVVADIPPEHRYAGAVSTGTTDWFTQEEAGDVPRLGEAYLEVPGGGRRTFAELAFLVKGLIEIPRTSDVDRSVFLAAYQSCSAPLRDEAGNLYIYRVIGVEPGHAPESPDKVRDEVIADLRLQRAYDAATARAEALARQARENGLKAAWDAAPQLQEQVEAAGFHAGVSFPRERSVVWNQRRIELPTTIPGIGEVGESFVRKCFELGPAEEGAEQVAVIQEPDRAAVAVVQWQQLQPLLESDYVKQRPQVVQQQEQLRLLRIVQEWLDPELIRSRNGFEWANRRG